VLQIEIKAQQSRVLWGECRTKSFQVYKGTPVGHKNRFISKIYLSSTDKQTSIRQRDLFQDTYS